jgi:uncharacterized protein YbjT (DUF2867 family)
MNGDDAVIGLIGAGGRTGQGMLPKLISGGLKLRLLQRSPSDQGLAPGIETRQADLGQPSRLADALAGCSHIYYIPPALDDREEEYARNLLTAMRSAEVSRVTYHSVLHAATPTLPHHARKARVEHIFRDSGAEWTILQPAMYTQSALAFLDIEAGLLSPAFDVRSRFTTIDLGDLAEAVLEVLRGSGYEFGTFELAGFENLSIEDMAAQLSIEFGRSIQAQEADRSRVLEGVTRVYGYTGEALREFECMLDHYDKHGLVGNGKVLSWLLGRRPSSFRDLVRQTFN